MTALVILGFMAFAFLAGCVIAAVEIGGARRNKANDLEDIA